MFLNEKEKDEDYRGKYYINMHTYLGSGLTVCKRTLKARTQEADTVLGEQILPWLTEVAPRTGSTQILVSVLGATW